MVKRLKHHPYYRFYFLFWSSLVGLVLAVFLFFQMVAWGWFGKLPPIEELENPKSSLASEIISSDGEVIGKYYLQNRSNVNFKDLNPSLVNALIATEDIRFYEHSGVDIKGLTRAVIFMGRDGGASTITQQLAKNLFHNPSQSLLGRILQKFKEWVIAIRLERRYTKEDYHHVLQYRAVQR